MAAPLKRVATEEDTVEAGQSALDLVGMLGDELFHVAWNVTCGGMSSSYLVAAGQAALGHSNCVRARTALFVNRGEGLRWPRQS